MKAKARVVMFKHHYRNFARQIRMDSRLAGQR